MRNLFCLSDAQMVRLNTFSPKSHGRTRANDSRAISCKCWIKFPRMCWRKIPYFAGSAISRACDWRLRFLGACRDV